MSAHELFEPGQLFEDSALGRGTHVVFGGPGSGKTRLVVDLTCHWASRLTVVTLASRRAAADRLRAEVHSTLLRERPDQALARPLVRTTHSYAFAVLEARARASSNPPPRLIPAAEQDATLRELLTDQAALVWPVALRGALGSLEFIAQLRSVFQRAAQHGLGPEGLIALGKERSRPEWVAAGRTWREYEQVMALKGAVGMVDPVGSASAVDAAELLAAALDAVADDPGVLMEPCGGQATRLGASASVPGRLAVFVDDAQHFDPQAARLASLLVRRADLAVVTADPDQSVFWFQGADGGVLRGASARLGPSARFAQSVAGLVGQLAPNTSAHKPGHALTLRDVVGSADVRLYPTTAAQAEAVALALCRAHSRDRVPWSRMAVLVRSVAVFAPSLTRAAALADVPLTVAGSGPALASNPTVRALATVLRSAARGELAQDAVIELLVSPLAGAGIAEIRALRRQLRAGSPERGSLELLTELVLGEEQAPQPVLRLRAVWQAAVGAGRNRQSVEEVLWAAWSASELEERWGASAAAETDFAAVRALFDLARQSLPTETYGASGSIAGRLVGFAERVEAARLPGPARAGGSAWPESVVLLSAHEAAGQEWDVVVVCGVQEGLWPGSSESGSLLGVSELAEALAGTPPEAKLDTRREVLAQERRLLYLACSRARDQLLVTAVDGEDGLMPSRFLPQPRQEPERAPVPTTPWSVTGVVSALRALACGDDQARAQRAAQALARLAHAGVAGAHPKSWHGLVEVSTSDPLSQGAVQLSPSRVEQLLGCPLRWLFEQTAAAGQAGGAAAIGTAVHLVASCMGRFGAQELHDAIAEAARRADEATGTAVWAAGRRRAQLMQLFTTLQAWHMDSRAELTEVGVEVPVDVIIPALSRRSAALSDSRVPSGHPAHVDSFRLASHPADSPGAPGAPEVRLKGRVDRLERAADGGLVVVDLKTAKTPRSAADVEADAQLACYQIAVAATSQEPVQGARLVFLGAARKDTGAAQRHQGALTEAARAEWTEVILGAGAAAMGPEFAARPNPGCGSCPGRRCCPAWSATIKRGQDE